MERQTKITLPHMFFNPRVCRWTIFLYTLFFLMSCSAPKNNLPQNLDLNNGDIIFRRGGSAMSFCVRAVDDKGFYTHIGIAAEINGKFYAIHSVPDEVPTGDFDRVKMEPINDFFEDDKALNGAVYRTKFSAEDLKIVTDETLRFYEKKVPFDDSYNIEDSTEIYCSELLVRSFDKINYDITAGNFTNLNIALFTGKHILPSDILMNEELKLIYSY